jgi:pantetheine-phosphate adenylyltransferase
MSASSRLAVFPGSFDPLTNGHLDVIRRSTRIFDRVVVALLVNPDKTPWLSIEDRKHAILECTNDLPGVEVDTFQGLLVDYAVSRGATALVRGLRGVADFDYEWQMALMNRHLAADLETVVLMPAPQFSYVSSRLVREIAALNGSLAGLVPAPVEALLERRRRAATVRHA